MKGLWPICRPNVGPEIIQDIAYSIMVMIGYREKSADNPSICLQLYTTENYSKECLSNWSHTNIEEFNDNLHHSTYRQWFKRAEKILRSCANLTSLYKLLYGLLTSQNLITKLYAFCDWWMRKAKMPHSLLSSISLKTDMSSCRVKVKKKTALRTDKFSTQRASVNPFNTCFLRLSANVTASHTTTILSQLLNRQLLAAKPKVINESLFQSFIFRSLMRWTFR